MRIEQLRREFDLTVRYRVFPLHPEIPEAGMPLSELFAGRLDVSAMMSRLRRVAEELDLPLGERTHTYNSRRAQELSKWAEAQQCGGGLPEQPRGSGAKPCRTWTASGPDNRGSRRG